MGGKGWMKETEEPSHGLAELTAGGDEDMGGALLPGWVQHWSEEHKCHYYWHAATKIASWERPAVPDEDDDEDNPENEGDGKLWDGEGSEEGAAHIATPFTPLVSNPGRMMTPATPVKTNLNGSPAAVGTAPSKRNMQKPPGVWEAEEFRPSQMLMQVAQTRLPWQQPIPAW